MLARVRPPHVVQRGEVERGAARPKVAEQPRRDGGQDKRDEVDPLQASSGQEAE